MKIQCMAFIRKVKTASGATAVPTINAKSKQLKQKLIDNARAFAGIKGHVTALDIPDEEVIAYYHQLFQIEATFRMAKSDLRARPIYHHNCDAIEAHLTIGLVALVISRNIEYQTGISIKQFVKLLRTIRSGIVTFMGKSSWPNLRYLRSKKCVK